MFFSRTFLLQVGVYNLYNIFHFPLIVQVHRELVVCANEVQFTPIVVAGADADVAAIKLCLFYDDVMGGVDAWIRARLGYLPSCQNDWFIR